MSIHSPQKWQQHTAFNMMQAQRSHDGANRQANLSQQAREDTASGSLTMYSELYSSMTQKVSNSNGLIDMLQKRADSLESSFQQTRQSLVQLEVALRAKEPPLQLCQWRLQQRQERPPREQVRDVVEVALEKEQAVLQEAQRQLEDAARRTRTVIGELEAKLDEVRRDADEKKQALGVDEMCLRTADSSFRSTMDRTARAAAPNDIPSSPGSKRFQVHDPTAFREASRNELIRQRKVAYIDHLADSKEQAAAALREESAALMARCKAASEEARSGSDRALQQRVDENQQVRARLESEVKETHAKIEHMSGAISETRVQLKALEEPMEMNSACAAWRKQRAGREDISDPVSAKLRDHQESVQRAQMELAGAHQSEAASLQRLQERREHLLEDLKDKTAALHIDRGCLAGGPQGRLDAPTPEPRAESRLRMADAAAGPLWTPGSAAPRPVRTPQLSDGSLSSRRSSQRPVLQMTARQLTGRSDAGPRTTAWAFGSTPR